MATKIDLSQIIREVMILLLEDHDDLEQFVDVETRGLVDLLNSCQGDIDTDSLDEYVKLRVTTISEQIGKFIASEEGE
jgi:hypothetical protein